MADRNNPFAPLVFEQFKANPMIDKVEISYNEIMSDIKKAHSDEIKELQDTISAKDKEIERLKGLLEKLFVDKFMYENQDDGIYPSHTLIPAALEDFKQQNNI
jgi:TolA-binding protein